MRQTSLVDALSLPIQFSESRGRPALLVDGVVQSVAPQAAAGGYWEALLPENRPRRTLVLGFGGGTVAYLLAARFRDPPVVAVDIDPRVVAARAVFGPLPANLQIVIADARLFIDGCAGRFDCVIVDLYSGARIPAGSWSRPFLRALRAAVAPRGRAIFNLFNDQRTDTNLRRLEQVFTLERVVVVGQNRIAHCRA